MGSVCSCSRRYVRLPSARHFKDAETLDRGDSAIFQIDVWIEILAGDAIKLSDIMQEISVKTNIRDVKHSLSAALSCSMYIIKLIIDAGELSNSSLLSHLGHQSSILNLTVTKQTKTY